MLPPNFEMMPAELRSLPRWVAWSERNGKKVPFCVTAVKSTASSTDPNTWAPFNAAQVAFEEGGYSGVGFVLNGDGIVGVDMDGCVARGVPSPDALALLHRIGCQYIELSPSGNGLRGFGYGDNIKGRRGILDSLRVELYSNQRYLTVTGHALKTGPLVLLPGFSEVAHLLGNPSPTEEDRRDTGLLLKPSVSSVGFPSRCLPVSEGERHRCVFELARFVKGQRPDATRKELQAIAEEWHRLALPVIRTKDFTATWADFQRAWELVEQPHGAILKAIIESIDFTAPLPPGIEGLGYGPAGHRLVHICVGLQAHEGDAPFFISARQAGELIGMHFTDASKVLAALCHDGVLHLVQRGAGKVASRYRYVWDK